jgi:hypothetical protein
MVLLVFTTSACGGENSSMNSHEFITATSSITEVLNTTKSNNEVLEISTSSTPDDNSNIIKDSVTPSKTLTASQTQTHTTVPTITSTPVPTLIPHNWTPNTLLVYLDRKGGDGCCEFPSPPGLVLYSDGQLFIYTWIEDQTPQLLTKTLSKSEICYLLNSIDQTGFFDYDESSYLFDRFDRPIDRFPIDGSDSTFIVVNAWRSKSVNLYALSSFIWYEEYFVNFPKEMSAQPPTILPALKNAFLLLSTYSLENLTPYQPNLLELWISPIDSTDSFLTWPLDSPSLSDLINNSQQDDFFEARRIVIEKESANQVFALFHNSIEGQIFSDGKNTVFIYPFPLLPYSFDSNLFFSTDFQPTPIPSGISCKPSDGMLIWP